MQNPKIEVKTVVFLSLLFFSSLGWAQVAQRDVDEVVEKELLHTVKLGQWFHRYPELSGQEKKTAKRIAQELRKLDMQVFENVGGYGVIGVMQGEPGNRMVLLRADMDALPIEEATGLAYSSQNKGVMHACGHDLHMSNMIGTLRVLHKLRNRFVGKVLVVFQPAEETGEGARAVLKDKQFTSVIKRMGKPNLALALHDAGHIPAGDIAVNPGHVTANVDSVDVLIYGRGGHGAKPQATIDPVVIGSDIVMSLQSIVSRRIRPGEPAVITVGQFQAGTKHNIIPDTAKLLLTVRSYGDPMREFVHQEIRRVVYHVALAHNAPQEPSLIVRDEYTPSGFNHPAWTANLRKRWEQVLSPDNVKDSLPVTIGEDFSQYGRQLGIPSVLFWLGATRRSVLVKAEQENVPDLHSARFVVDFEGALRTGMRAMTHGVLLGLAGVDN